MSKHPTSATRRQDVVMRALTEKIVRLEEDLGRACATIDTLREKVEKLATSKKNL